MSNRSRYAKLQEQQNAQYGAGQPSGNPMPNAQSGLHQQHPHGGMGGGQMGGIGGAQMGGMGQMGMNNNNAVAPNMQRNPYGGGPTMPVSPVMGNPNNIGNVLNTPNASQGMVGQSPSKAPLAPQSQQPAQEPSKPLDYRKLPNPTKGLGDKAQRRITTLFTKKYESQSGVPIPRPEEEFIVDDSWNCSPKFMRSTMFHIPTANDVKKVVGIPLGIHISPLAEQHPEEMGIPLIDHGTEGPIRCNRCRAYINPYVSWNQSGTQYACPFCGNTNDVPLSYACPMIGAQRQDISQRPELYKGTVEFVTTDMYKTRPPTVPVYIFVVDASYASVASGMLHSFCSAMQRILPALFNESPIPIGIVTYDDRVSCYEVSPSLSKPRIAVMPDVNKPYCPAPPLTLLQPYSNEGARAHFDQLLEIIPQMASNAVVSPSCLGAALQVAMKMLQSVNSIGKICLFSTGMPELGVGKMTKRFQNPESDKEKLLFAPQLPFYTEMGGICVKNGVSVDLFLGSSVYADAATLGEMSRMTGGQIYYYPSFNIQNHGEQLFRELYRNTARECGFDGLLRVRTSNGINQDFESGHFVKSSETDLAIAHASCDTSLYLEFQIDEKMKENDAAYFQCAYLYTNKAGVRIIRIHNLKLYATAGIPKIFKGADLDAILNALIRKSLPLIQNDTMKACRAQLLQQSVDILAAYRLHCVLKTSNMGQLILPEALRLLPIYILSVLKSHLYGQLKQGSLYPILHDARFYAMSMFKSLNLRDLGTYIYPLLYKIHTLVEHPLFGTTDDNGGVFFPGMARPTSKMFTANSVFLIDTLDKLFLWIGAEVDAAIVDDLLSPEENSPQVFDLLIPLSKKETDLSERLFNILGSRQLQRMLSPDIFIIRQGSNMEAHLSPYLVEDVYHPPREPKDMDYTEFLRHMHNLITTKNKV